ncbi:polysaccharide biosynthesis tyrosine autokinase [Rhabdobacter roseus]|uniref:Capsular exopolysaccharide synthesis family protein n=1 Tax=Rhabdobacter roseus TaxID=1655419 RepID=A0A840TTV2_9BACT|nr:polysaccharide biosynthesis tyrosine autokinase [Rhabdobacter roseus]MBB5284982.1 capsular exopolysaccharide synthesis family protein [Rhabdobacter roseus]
MNRENENAFFEQLLGSSESINFQRVGKVFLSRWYWIVSALILAGIFCFLYLKLATPQYVTSVTLKYSDKQSELDEISSSKPTFLFNTSSNDYLTEKYNVQSPEVVQNAISKLNNSFTFYRMKDLRRIDVYPYKPLVLEVLAYDPKKYQHGTFHLETDFELLYEVNEQEVPFKLAARAIITVPGLTFRINKIDTQEDYLYEFTFNDPARLVSSLAWRISLDEVEEAMPVMSLSFRHHNYKFTEDFLEKLLEAYGEYDLKQKQQSSDLTIRFIKDQVEVYAASLKEAARDLELFKQRNQLFNVSSSASEITGKVRELEQRKNELEIQRAYIAMLEKNLGSTFEPVNYLSIGLDGTTDGVLIGLLERFNTLISQRKDLLLKFSPNAATIRNLDEELNKYRQQILENIALQEQKNTGTIKILTENINTQKSRFGQIPALEKNYIYLQSSFDVNQNIYSLLINKEIESSIVRAGMLPSFRVITQPETDKVSPKSFQIITLFVFAGLLLGLGSVLTARYFNQSFSDIGRVDTHPRVSLLGIVHHFPQKITNSGQDLTNFLTDRNIFTESMSALRTRLSFSKSKREGYLPGEGKQIIITSEKSGEGKSFVTVNLALSLTKIGKRVVVIGADLRKSRLHLFFNDSNQRGLSDFLQEKITDLTKVPLSSSVPNLYYIPAGPAPFNPGELLQKPLFETLLAYCRQQYDYVLIDTAPVGLVADNVPLLQQCDHVLFILRWLYSDQEAYRIPGQLADEYDLPEVKVIVNDFYPDNLHGSFTSSPSYGSGYSHYRYDYAYRDNGYLSNGQPSWKERLRKGFRRRNNV